MSFIYNMKKSKLITYTIGAFLLLSTVILGGCGVTSKVLKTGNAELIYQTALDLYESGEWNKAANLFDAVKPYYTGSSRDDSVQFFSARCRYKNKEYQVASQQLDEFRRQYGRSIFLEDAEGMYTLCHYFLAPGPTRDSGLIKTAIITIDEFMSRYPDSAQLSVFQGLSDELVLRLHEKSFANAYTYYKTGYYKSAIVAFKNALKEYPNSNFREEISYYIVASAYELGSNSVVSKKEDRFLDMVDSYYTFIAAYPESKYRDEVDQMLKKANSYIERMKRGEIDEDGNEMTGEAKREPKAPKEGKK